MTTEHETVGDVLAAYDDSVNEQIKRVSTVLYNSKEICTHFAGELRKAFADRIERAHAADVAMREAVRKMTQALESGEWAEHALDSDDDVSRLEAQITRLVGAHAAGAGRVPTISEDEMQALRRFDETASDDNSTDLSDEMLCLLARKGALGRGNGRGEWVMTEYGWWLLSAALDPKPAPEADLLRATRRLVITARTSGGTAGRDDELCAALDAIEPLLAAKSSPEPPPAEPAPQPAPSDAPASPQAAQGDDPVRDFLRYFEHRGESLFFTFGWEGVDLYNAAVKAHRLASAQPATAKPAGDAEFKVGDRVGWVSETGEDGLPLEATVESVNIRRKYTLRLSAYNDVIHDVPASSLTRLTGGSHD